MHQKAKEDKARAIDRALFDFDEEIDNLKEVEDRYPMNLPSHRANKLQLENDNEKPDSPQSKESSR